MDKEVRSRKWPLIGNFDFIHSILLQLLGVAGPQNDQTFAGGYFSGGYFWWASKSCCDSS